MKVPDKPLVFKEDDHIIIVMPDGKIWTMFDDGRMTEDPEYHDRI